MRSSESPSLAQPKEIGLAAVGLFLEAGLLSNLLNSELDLVWRVISGLGAVVLAKFGWDRWFSSKRSRA